MDAKDNHPAGQVPSVFDVDEETRSRMQTAYERGVRSIRNVLFLVAGMTALAALLMNLGRWGRGFSPEVLATLALNAVIVCAYIGLGFWALKKPYYALLAGIALTFCIQIAGWVITGKVVGVSLLTFVLFLSSFRKAKALQRYPFAIYKEHFEVH